MPKREMSHSTHLRRACYRVGSSISDIDRPLMVAVWNGFWRDAKRAENAATVLKNDPCNPVFMTVAEYETELIHSLNRAERARRVLAKRYGRFPWTRGGV